MSKFLKRLGLGLIIIVLICCGTAFWYLNSKKAVRTGTTRLPGLSRPVEVRFDTFAIPHIYAQNQTDAYYALGYLHAQDRLFHMELLRRLAKGELAQILGSSLVSTDSFFRTLRLKQFGKEYIDRADTTSPAFQICQAYIDGINHFINTGPAPVEFDILGIEKKQFQLSDIISVAGYMAYSFAAGFKSEPVLTFVRDELGQAYLTDMGHSLSDVPPLKLLADTHRSLAETAALVADIETDYSPVGFFEGSNAWAVSGSKTVSGKPILAGDPHIAHSCPSVWYEAHIVTPDHNFYGHFLSGVPMAMLGSNGKVAWTLTMFQNDDLDMFAEKANPDNPDQVWSDGQWTDLEIEHETIRVKNENDLDLKIRISKHGPIINDILDTLNKKKNPVAVSWAFHDFGNDFINGLYEMSHLSTVHEAPPVLEKIYAPGLNVVMGDTSGNIGWFAVARLPRRPEQADPNFILDGSDPANDYTGTWPFAANPQFINPASGLIISANHQPQDFGTGTVPGYYNIENRAQRIETLLNEKPSGWSMEDMKAIQLDTESAYYKNIRDKQVAVLKQIPAIQEDPVSRRALALLEEWDGFHNLDSTGAAVFYTLFHTFTRNTFKDELGDDLYKAFLKTRLPDRAAFRIVDNPDSPWWDDRTTPSVETRQDILSASWFQAMDDLIRFAGNDPEKWLWENFHTVEYVHALGRQKPLDKIFNIGPFKSEGAREVPNFQGFRITPPPFEAYIGPSTRRIFDFADPDRSLGINPSGQSGYFFDPHFDDQARLYFDGKYRPQLTNRAQIEKATASVLQLTP